MSRDERRIAILYLKLPQFTCCVAKHRHHQRLSRQYLKAKNWLYELNKKSKISNK